jgi:hypothetical protein
MKCDQENRQLRAIVGFGCVSWKPKLTDGETEEIQLNHEMALKRMYECGESVNDEVKQLCSISYYLQTSRP